MSSIARKDFIKQILISAGVGMALPLNSFAQTPAPQNFWISPNDTILFQGDSITDAGRNREHYAPNTSQGLGQGYAALASAHLLFKYGTFQLKCYNRGISGNKVPQLQERWQTDCLDLKPQILSILIGVNDFWHQRTHGYKGTPESYKDEYKKLLDNTLEHLPNVKLIIGEPFAFPGLPAVSQDWFPTFDAYRAAAQSIAESYQAKWVPYQQIFEVAMTEVPASYWTYDGVHTTLAGAQLMAEAWLGVAKHHE